MSVSKGARHPLCSERGGALLRAAETNRVNTGSTRCSLLLESETPRDRETRAREPSECPPNRVAVVGFGELGELPSVGL